MQPRVYRQVQPQMHPLSSCLWRLLNSSLGAPSSIVSGLQLIALSSQSSTAA